MDKELPLLQCHTRIHKNMTQMYYYNPGCNDYMRGKPEPPEMGGCFWQIVAVITLLILLVAAYYT